MANKIFVYVLIVATNVEVFNLRGVVINGVALQIKKVILVGFTAIALLTISAKETSFIIFIDSRAISITIIIVRKHYDVSDVIIFVGVGAVGVETFVVITRESGIYPKV